jgi:4-hydroxy-tetrahydrodipicolinate synthase
MEQRTNRYPGVFPAMSTPLTESREIDHEGLKNVVGYLFDNGVDGLSILGSTGECSALRREQRKEALEVALEAGGERGTIFTGASGSVMADVIADLKAIDGLGARGALVPPPFYYPINDEGVVTFYEHVAEASPVPIILYHIPRITKVPITPAAVARLIEHPNIIGLKDSSGDFSNFTEIARLANQTTGFTLYTGSDAMLAASLFVGGHGIIGAGVNIVPDVVVAVYQAVMSGDKAKAIEMQHKVADAVNACRVGNFPGAYKAQYTLKGLCQPYMAWPIPTVNDAEMRELRANLVAAGVLSAE